MRRLWTVECFSGNQCVCANVYEIEEFQLHMKQMGQQWDETCHTSKMDGGMKVLTVRIYAQKYLHSWVCLSLEKHTALILTDTPYTSQMIMVTHSIHPSRHPICPRTQ